MSTKSWAFEFNGKNRLTVRVEPKEQSRKEGLLSVPIYNNWKSWIDFKLDDPKLNATDSRDSVSMELITSQPSPIYDWFGVKWLISRKTLTILLFWRIRIIWHRRLSYLKLKIPITSLTLWCLQMVLLDLGPLLTGKHLKKGMIFSPTIKIVPFWRKN
jgi:hypothetical protein